MKECCSESTTNIDNFFKNAKSVKKEQFDIYAISNSLMNLKQLEYLPYLSFEFPQPSNLLMCNCIKYLLRPSTTLNDYLLNHLNVGEKYYLINMDFWDIWKQTVGWNNEDIKQSPRKVELDVPIQPDHTLKLSSSLVYGKNFELVPEKVYKLFKKWYHFEKSIPVSRKVISYLQNSPQKYDPNEAHLNKLGKTLTRLKACYIHELELTPYFLQIIQLKEDEEPPSSQKLNTLKKIFFGEYEPLQILELYISRYLYD